MVTAEIQTIGHSRTWHAVQVVHATPASHEEHHSVGQTMELNAPASTFLTGDCCDADHHALPVGPTVHVLLAHAAVRKEQGAGCGGAWQ